MKIIFDCCYILGNSERETVKDYLCGHPCKNIIIQYNKGLKSKKLKEQIVITIFIMLIIMCLNMRNSKIIITLREDFVFTDKIKIKKLLMMKTYSIVNLFRKT